MAETSAIEWTDATWNPVTGCTLVSEGCRHCYAAKLAATRLKDHPSRKGLARRNAAGEYKFTGEVRLNEQWLDQPLHWTRPRKIFVCAHGDLFHEAVPDEWIDRVFAVMALARQHTFQVLTKRPERMREYLLEKAMPARIGRAATAITEGRVFGPLPNVWLGTSVEDQATADARIPHLLSSPAAIRFVSYEPALGPVDFASPYSADLWETAMDEDLERGIAYRARSEEDTLPGLHWIIAGGESGPHARPAHPDWFRQTRDQCAAAGVPFFFKQWGEWAPLFDRHGNQHPAAKEGVETMPLKHATHVGRTMIRVGKKAAGALLDGREHQEFPKVAT